MKRDKAQIVELIINHDPKVKEVLLDVITDKNYVLIRSVVYSLDKIIRKNKLNKEIKDNFIQIVANNILDVDLFDGDMNLKKDYSFLEDYKTVLLTHLIDDLGMELTEDNVIKLDDQLLASLLAVKKERVADIIVTEIMIRLANNNFEINHLKENEIENLLKACMERKNYTLLELLFNNEIFLNLLDTNNLDILKVIEFTKECNFLRKGLLSLGKTKKLVCTNTKDVADLFNKEEIRYLWQDNEIKNSFMALELRFDCLDKSSQEQLLEEIDSFYLFKLETLNAFLKGLANLAILANNLDFIFIYLEKLKMENIGSNEFISSLKKEVINEMIDDARFSALKKEAILCLLANLNEECLEVLLQNKKVEKIAKDNNNLVVYSNLPNELQLNILKERNALKNIDNIKMFCHSKKDVIKYFFKNDKDAFKEFTNILAQDNKVSFTELKLVVDNLTKKELDTLIYDELSVLNGKTIIFMININKNILTKNVLNDAFVCQKVIDSIDESIKEETKELLSLMNDNEKVALVTKALDIKNEYGLIQIVKSLKDESFRELFNNKRIRELLLKNSCDEIFMNDIIKDYLMVNKEEISYLSANTIAQLITLISIKDAKDILKKNIIIDKLFSCTEDKKEKIIIKIIEHNSLLLPCLINEYSAKYLSSDILQTLIGYLTIEDQLYIANNKALMKKLYGDIFPVYKSLMDKNKVLLNTLRFNFLNKDTITLKFAHLEYITKRKKLQDDLLTIWQKKKFNSKFITSLINITDKINGKECLENIVNLLSKSIEGSNRKKIGNFEKILDFENEICLNDITKIVSYFLFIIPHYKTSKSLVKRPIGFISVPSTYDEVINYEVNFEKYMSEQIKLVDNNNYENYFFLKHYKMSKEEVRYFLKMFDINKVDENIYKNELKFIKELNNLVKCNILELKELDKKVKIYSIIDIFKFEYRLKEMYNKIYSYELGLSINNLKKVNYDLFGKKVPLYEAKENFIYLIHAVNLNVFLEKTVNYKEAWDEYLSNSNEEICLNLIANDNLNIEKQNFYYGFSQLAFNTISEMAPYDLQRNRELRFLVPRMLINSTRKQRNSIIFNVFEQRNNYVSANPYIVPDYLLVFKDMLEDDINILENVYRASVDMGNKVHKTLPIIVLDRKSIIEKEVKKLESFVTEYQKGDNLIILAKILLKFQNNNSYYNFNSLYDGKKIEDLFESRINLVMNVEELNQMLEIINQEIMKEDSDDDMKEGTLNLKKLINLIDRRKANLRNLKRS